MLYRGYNCFVAKGRRGRKEYQISAASQVFIVGYMSLPCPFSLCEMLSIESSAFESELEKKERIRIFNQVHRMAGGDWNPSTETVLIGILN